MIVFYLRTMFRRSYLIILFLFCFNLFPPICLGAGQDPQSSAGEAMPEPAQPSVVLYLDGQVRPLQNPLIVRNGITYGPFREIISILGAEPGYTLHFNRLFVWAELEGHSLLLEAGTNVFYLNNRIASLPGATFIHNGTLYFPLRFMLELCAHSIHWSPPAAVQGGGTAETGGGSAPAELLSIFIKRPVPVEAVEAVEEIHPKPVGEDNGSPIDGADAPGEVLAATPGQKTGGDALFSRFYPCATELTGLPDHFVRTARSVPVFMYHHLQPAAAHDGSNGAIVSVEEFQKQMDYLFKKGYYTVSLEDLYLFIRDEKSLPQKAVVLTFDDGYLSNYEYAFPILQQYHFRAAQFRITSFIAKSYPWLPHMEWEQMAEAASVFEYHGHTHNLHYFVNNRAALLVMEKEQARADLLRSRELLNCFAFAYPFGRYSNDTIQLLQETGYKMAFTIRSGSVRPGDDPFTIKRYAVYPHTSLQDFAAILQAAR